MRRYGAQERLTLIAQFHMDASLGLVRTGAAEAAAPVRTRVSPIAVIVDLEAPSPVGPIATESNEEVRRLPTQRWPTKC